MAIPYVDYDITADTKVSDEQRALVTELGLEVRRFKDERYEVTDPLYRDVKNGGGKYAGKDFTGVLNDATYTRKKLLEANPAAAVQKSARKGAAAAPSNGGATSDMTATGKTRRNKKDASASSNEKAGTRKAKAPKIRKDNRYLRAARVVAADLSLVPPGKSGKEWGPYQAKLSKAVGDISIASAGHFFEAWVNITNVLTDAGWLKLPKVQIVEKKA